MKKFVGLFLVLCAIALTASAQRRFFGLPKHDHSTEPPRENQPVRPGLFNPIRHGVDFITGSISSVARHFLKPFQDFQTKYNKQYSSPEEEKERLEIFAHNGKLIEERTTKNRFPFLYKINEFGDMIKTEFLTFLSGLRFKPYKRIKTTTTEMSTTSTTTEPCTSTPEPPISTHLPSTTTTQTPAASTTTTTTTEPCTSTPEPPISTHLLSTTTTQTPASSTTTTPVPTTTPATTTTTTTTPKPTTTTVLSITEEGKPGNVDWRRLNCMSEVRYQAKCAASFAFATTAAIEAHICYKTGKHYVLSPQNLIDCTIASPFENSGCEGGALEPTFDYVVNVGLNTEDDYKYQGKVSKCKFKPEKSIGKIADYMSIDEGDEGTMEWVLNNLGPITVGIDATHESFRFYGGGIYYEPNCKSSIEDLNHAVLLVGYGEEDGQKYWLIRNSYGTSWGDNGYGKISRNTTNHCGIATYAVYPII